MYAVPQKPQSIGRVLDAGFRLFRAQLPRVFLLALIAGLPNTAVSALELFWYRDAHAPMAFVPAYLVALLISLMFYAAMVHALAYAAQGVSSTLGGNVAVGARKTGWVFLATLVYGVAVLVGTLALVLPGIWLLIAFCLFMIPIVVEDGGPLEGLAVSYRTVRGYWWRTLLVFTVISLIVLAVYLVVAALAAIVAGIGIGIGALLGAGAGAASDAADWLALIGLAMQLVMGALLGPAVYAVLVVHYYDLKLRKNGSNLGARIQVAIPERD